MIDPAPKSVDESNVKTEYFRIHSDAFTSLLSELLASTSIPLLRERLALISNKTSSRNNSEIQSGQQNPNDPLPPSANEISISDEFSSNEASEARDQLEFPTQLVVEIVIGKGVFDGEISKSTLQPLAADGAPTDDKSCPSSDTSQSGKPGEKLNGIVAPRPEKCPIYASLAQDVFQSVLKKILQYNEENGGCPRFVSEHLNDSMSSSTKCRSDYDLMNYLAGMKIELPLKFDLKMTREMTTENYTVGAFKALTKVVITTLILILTARTNRNFDEFMFNYVFFRNLYDTFTNNWKITNIEVVKDEVTRKRLMNFQINTLKLMSVALLGFRLFFLYVGENAEESKMDVYDEYLIDDDKAYLGRK